MFIFDPSLLCLCHHFLNKPRQNWETIDVQRVNTVNITLYLIEINSIQIEHIQHLFKKITEKHTTYSCTHQEVWICRYTGHHHLCHHCLWLYQNQICVWHIYLGIHANVMTAWLEEKVNKYSNLIISKWFGDFFIYTYLFKNNGTLYFSNKIKTVNHIDLILSGIHIHPWSRVSCKF